MHFPIPKPVRGRIAQVYSQSDDPSAASLLAIAPELRNQIYEYLLIDFCPITIENEVEDDNDDTVSKVSDFWGSSAIIRTCRQVYHEAVGILYSRNVFHFQYNVRYHGEYGVTFTSPAEMCIEWVKDIGSCLSGLRTVIINMDVPDIPQHCEDLGVELDVWDHARTRMPILPLLDLFWNEIAHNISVQFEGIMDDSSDSDDEEPDKLIVSCLTSALCELGKKDALGLKITRRLLRHVYVNPSGTRGTIIYWSTGQRIQVHREFQLSMETQKYEFVPLPKPLSLLHLPAKIIRAIARLSIKDLEVTYNFQTGVTHGNSFGLLNVNKQLRNIVHPVFLYEGRFTLIVGFDSLQPAKALYEVLERRIAETFEDSRLYNSHMWYCTPIEAAQDYENEPTIVLQFQTIDHIRINAWDLLRVTTVFPPGGTIIVRVRGHSDNLHSTTLGEIRKYALVFMEDLKLKATPDNRRSIVEVSLNEQCLPVRVIFRKGDHELEDVDSNMAKAVDVMDIASLHKKVGTVTWKHYEQMNGFKCVTQPKSWDDKTAYGLVKVLRSLC